MEYQRYTVDTAVWPPRFCKLELVAEDGTRLAFVNSRRLGRVRFFDDPCAHPPISTLGFDPLLDLPPLPAFTAALASRGQAIKAVLLDQSFSAGVGNWIADEVVYQARVHPSHPCRSLTAQEAARLHAALGSVVQAAVAANANSKKFPPSWLFHFRWVKGAAGAKDAHGNPIAFLTVGGRTSAVVAAVQGSGKGWKARDAALHIGSGPAQTVKAAPAGAAKRKAGRRKGLPQAPPLPPADAAAAVAAAAAAAGETVAPRTGKGTRKAATRPAARQRAEAGKASEGRKPSKPARGTKRARGAPAVDEELPRRRSARLGRAGGK